MPFPPDKQHFFYHLKQKEIKQHDYHYEAGFDPRAR